ncbi:MAG: TMEM175 family protein [Ginsengibacter sp.]
MSSTRLEAFSDGVLAIIITIMVLEMKVPHGDDLHSLQPLVPVFISYVISFIYIGIYWNNHHHMMAVVEHVNGKVLWANIHLLFWLSLVPFATGWMGENNFTLWPVALYGTLLTMAAIAYYILAQTLIRLHGKDSTIGKAIGKDRKGVISLFIYIAGIALCSISPKLGLSLYALVAAIWLVPDKRIEKKIVEEHHNEGHAVKSIDRLG